jgi:quinoprotein glucose dehydrogenase
MKGRSNDELTRLLAHADVRVRQGAQFALADQGENAIAVFSATASKGSPLLARLHAIWGLGQIGRKAPKALEPVKELLDDGDAEVRSQATKVVGDGHVASAVPKLIGLLRDDSLRVRFFAAISLGKLGSRDALGPILAMLRENADRDPYLRHAGVMALVGLDNEASLLAAARDESAAVRMGVLLALRRKGSPEVARFLEDAEPRLVLEAARAINDAPINAAMPRLAALPIRSGASEPLLRRVLNANFRLGEAEHASALAGLAGRNDVPESIRAEALQALGQWARPSGRDRVMGLWRPIDPRSPDVAANALRPQVADLLRSAPDDVREAAALAAGRLGIRDAGPGLLALVSDGEAPRDARIVALKALDGLHDERLAEAVERAATDSDARVRTEGLRLLAKLQPAEAVRRLEQALADGSAAERQGALDILGGIDEATAAATLSRWMDRLLANDVPAEIQLDLLEAAARQSSPDVKAKLARYEAGRRMDDPLAAYREALAGGNARRGRGIFQQKAEVSCLRCHKVRGEGGEVGPDLTGIGGKQGREYLLESLVAPNKQIAQGFETRVVATSDGQVHTGVFKSDTGDELRLVTAEGQPLSIPKSEIEDEKRGASAMPDDLVKSLSKSELRDLVEFLSSLK